MEPPFPLPWEDAQAVWSPKLSLGLEEGLMERGGGVMGGKPGPFSVPLNGP